MTLRTESDSSIQTPSRFGHARPPNGHEIAAVLREESGQRRRSSPVCPGATPTSGSSQHTMGREKKRHRPPPAVQHAASPDKYDHTANPFDETNARFHPRGPPPLLSGGPERSERLSPAARTERRLRRREVSARTR
ncbi:hypothetical protein FQA47_024976 [Oryzias melastigma]|uniref:Uncharacterized protein n=1 Tax=Oryzias melastigma TaxID=30732 RepID=A0A834BV21_ORYME|nr:hypothetical protein FQA47_024976 [Oryzias melastigma]